MHEVNEILLGLKLQSFKFTLNYGDRNKVNAIKVDAGM